MIFSGLRSRCSTPCWCAAASASASWTPRIDEFCRAEAASRQLAAERLPEHQFVDYEACFRSLHEIEYGRDPWMIEARRSPRLRCQASPHGNIVSLSGQQHLERDRAVELRVKSAKHDAHTAAPNLFSGTVSTGNEFVLYESALVSQAASRSKYDSTPS